MNPLLHLFINPINRTRKNHALEHATLHILARTKNTPFAGYSDPAGFWIVGQVTTQEVQQAAEEALVRLKAGEYRLAVHQNCGTNYVTSGILAGSAAWLGMSGSDGNLRRRLDRLPFIIVLVTFVLIFAAPLGMKLQTRFTTQPNPGNMEIAEITTHLRGRIPAHRVLTRK